LAAAALAAACAEAGEPAQAPDHARTIAPIIGGIPTTTEPAVVAVLSGGICTGTLIAESVVLTAAHCVNDVVADGDFGAIRVFFGDDIDAGGTTRSVNHAAVHRYYDPESLSYDIAVVHMSSPAPDGIVPVVVNDQPLGTDHVGAAIELVGFGETGFGVGDSGRKRAVVSQINVVASQHLFVGTEDANTCKGDSGGPTFYTFADGRKQIGVTSRSNSCQPNSAKIRVDVMVDAFVWPYLDRYSDPCAFDGTCTTDCPRSPDPDCDICLWDGVCGSGCASADWDCPLGLRQGEACTDDSDCELRRCYTAPDDERVRYCAEPCVPAEAGACSTGTVCSDAAGDSVCVWPEPTPGVQGAPCQMGFQCRSGMCEDDLCVERCDEAPGGGCGPPYECRPSALVEGEICGLPIEDGCPCGVVGRGGRRGRSGVAGLVVFALWLALIRRAGDRRGG
jgi:V8-like Glu-specific endopeptidase